MLVTKKANNFSVIRFAAGIGSLSKSSDDMLALKNVRHDHGDVHYGGNSN